MSTAVDTWRPRQYPLLQCPQEPWARRLVLLTEDVVPLLRRLIESEGCSFDTLSQRSGIETRSIHRVLNYECASVGVDIIDKLLCAMAVPMAFAIPDEWFYEAGEVRKATIIQTELMTTCLRGRGIVHRINEKGARDITPQYRRMLAAA